MYSILYVDDEPGLLDIGKLYLELSGDIKVETTLSAHNAIELLNSQKYDGIISDYQMPEMDGITFLKYVRIQWGHLPFILFTGRGREEIVIEALNNGADFYLQKGGDPKAQFTELEFKVKRAIDLRRIEEDLRQSQQRMADIIDHLPDATFAVDLEGKVILWNRAMEEMTAVKKEDMEGTGTYSYAIPIYGERRPVLLDLVIKEDKDVEKKYPYILRKDHKIISEIFSPLLNGGKGAYLWVIVSPLFDLAGNVIGAIESIRDISDYRQIEKTLKESEERLRALLDSVSDVIRIIDRQGKIVFDTDTSERKLGYPPGFMLGKDLFEFIHPDDTAKMKRKLSKVIEKTSTGTPIEVRIRKADGGYTWVEGTEKNLLGVPGIDGIVIAAKLIDEKKDAARALRECEERFRILISSSFDGVIVHQDDRIVIANASAARIARAVSPDDMIGKSVLDFVHQDFKEKVAERVNRMLRFPDWLAPLLVIEKFIRFDGTTVDVEVMATATQYEGRPAVIVVFRDISDPHVAEDALHRHNIRQPDKLEKAMVSVGSGHG